MIHRVFFATTSWFLFSFVFFFSDATEGPRKRERMKERKSPKEEEEEEKVLSNFQGTFSTFFVATVIIKVYFQVSWLLSKEFFFFFCHSFFLSFNEVCWNLRAWKSPGGPGQSWYFMQTHMTVCKTDVCTLKLDFRFISVHSWQCSTECMVGWLVGWIVLFISPCCCLYFFVLCLLLVFWVR